MQNHCKKLAMLVRVMRFRPGLLAVVLPCLLLALAPGSAAAQSGNNAGECVESASQGTVKKYRCRLGPVRVGPFQVLTKELIFGIPKPALDGFVTDMSVDVVDTNGQPMPISRLMLHHIVFGNLGASIGSKTDPTCSDRGFLTWDTKAFLPAAAERFYAAGEERAKMKLPPGYGYPIASQDSWFMTYMFMNHRSKTDTAYVEYELTVDTRADLAPVDPYWLDVENCKTDPVYDVPGGRAQGRRRMSRRMNWTGAGGGPARRGGRSRARRRQGARPRPPRVPHERPGDLHVAAGLGLAQPPLLQREAGAARTGADQHERLLLRGGGSAGGRRAGGACNRATTPRSRTRA